MRTRDTTSEPTSGPSASCCWNWRTARQADLELATCNQSHSPRLNCAIRRLYLKSTADFMLRTHTRHHFTHHQLIHCCTWCRRHLSRSRWKTLSRRSRMKTRRSCRTTVTIAHSQRCLLLCRTMQSFNHHPHFLVSSGIRPTWKHRCSNFA